jgi:hypothetical protein
VDIYWTRLVRFASQLEPEACVVAIKTALTVEPTMTGKIISKGRQKNTTCRLCLLFSELRL